MLADCGPSVSTISGLFLPLHIRWIPVVLVVFYISLMDKEPKNICGTYHVWVHWTLKCSLIHHGNVYDWREPHYLATLGTVVSVSASVNTTFSHGCHGPWLCLSISLLGTQYRRRAWLLYRSLTTGSHIHGKCLSEQHGKCHSHGTR